MSDAGPSLERLRRLVVIHYPFFGGPHNQALRLDRPLRARGIETIVVLPAEKGNAAERLRAAGVEVIVMPLHRLRAIPNPLAHARWVNGFARDVGALSAVVRDRGVDVVEIAGLVNAQAAVAARRNGAAVIWQILDTRTPAVLRRVLVPVVRRLADVVMTTGTTVAALHGVDDLGDRLVPFVPPVDTRVFRPDTDARRGARERLRADDRTVVVGTVANITPQKDLETLVRAGALLRDRYAMTRVVIFGRGMETQVAYERRLRAAAAAAGVVVAAPSNVSADLNGLDVFLLTGERRSEGISTTAVEAMATGLPVVAVDVGGLSEIVRRGETGYLVPPGDVDAIVGAVASLVTDEDRRRAFGEAARRDATDRYDVENCADVHAQAARLAASLGRRRNGSI